MLVPKVNRVGKLEASLANKRKLLALFALALLLTTNGVGWMQAWSMTHFVSTGQRTPTIEVLTFPQKLQAILTGVTIPRPQNTHTPKDVGLAYQTHQIPIREGESLEAWYVPHPQPKGIVLMFSGYAESKESLLAPASALHDMQYDVFLVDFRGYGGSSGQDTTLGFREAKDVALAVDYVRHTWPGRPIVLYGVSMGAAAILRAVAVEGVKPEALILESSFDQLLSTVDNRFHSMGLPAFPAAELIVFWGSVQHGFNGFAHNPADYARAVTCPALLLHGERDPRVTTEQARALYDRLGGQKQFVEFPGAGHELLVNFPPQKWKNHLAGFLGGIGQ